jgi:phosphoribosylformimino-5-aminoimidazole carboxamide ribotide isomerase
MQLIPAIDIRAGGCVRLLRGDFDQETRYPVDPAELAREYRELGADWLHVVDLDGAARGRPVNQPTIRRIREASGLRLQLGGGIRDRASLTEALETADRVIVGSLAIAEPDVVAGWLEEQGGERIGLGLDVRLDGSGVPHVATHGWRRSSRVSLWEALDCYTGAPLRHVLCTDVDRDGALEGPNIALYRRCVGARPDLAWQASGGVRDAEDLARLADTGVSGAISGKALLEGRLGPEEMRPYLPSA